MRVNVNAVRIDPELKRVVKEFRETKNGRGHRRRRKRRYDGNMGEARNGNDNKGEARIQYNKGEALITATIAKARPVIV